MPKIIIKETKKEVTKNLSELKSFWLSISSIVQTQGKLSNEEAMSYISELKDIWITKFLSLGEPDDFEALALIEKSKRIYNKMMIYLEKFLDPVTPEEINEIHTKLTAIINTLLKKNHKNLEDTQIIRTDLKRYLKFVIDRLAIASKLNNHLISDKIQEVDRKLNIIIKNNHLYA